MSKKKNDTKVVRTMSSYVNINDKITNNILKFMTHESKNIYNATVYHTNIFLRYQNIIFKELLDLVTDRTIRDIQKFDITFYELYHKYYQRYMRIQNVLRINNQIIYGVIKNYLKQSNITIMNNNFNKIKKTVIKIIDENKLIVVSDCDKKELYLDIVSNILVSMYNRSFNFLKDMIMSRRPCTAFDTTFIRQVKNDERLFSKDIAISYKSILMEHKLFKIKKKKKKEKDNETEKEKKKETIKSNQSYIARIIYRYYTNCTIPSDVMCNIISKVYASFSSYFALLKNGKKANKPKFLDSNGHYILPFFKRSRKLIKKNGKSYYRLTIGNYIAEHYPSIVDNDQYICINPNATRFKKYVDEKYLLPCDRKILLKDNFIIGNRYIKKDSNKIIETSYIYIEKPPDINDKNLALIEINPLYDGTRFKINFTYKTNTTRNKPKKGKVISIDPGMTNLFTIHDPHGKQFIIKGSHIKDINNSHIKKIDSHKRKLAKYNSGNRKIERKNKTLPEGSRKKLVNNFDKGMMTRSKKMMEYMIEDKPFPSFPKQGKSEIYKSINYKCDLIKKMESGKHVTEFPRIQTSKKLRKLCLDRNNQIDNYFNHVCNWIINKYSDCETIIIGNNKGWKTKCNMGKKTNRNFYAIPYRKLFDKLIHKAEQNNQKVCIIGEAYTSKCDALAFEEICHHDKYSGKRTKRGLFASRTKKYINADLNGAINIMRKWYTSNGLDMKKIRGKKIYNPKCVPLLEIMKWD